MKLGIISRGGTPTLAAVYDGCWAEVPAALAALGREPVTELRTFIEGYGDEVVSLNAAIGALTRRSPRPDFVHPLDGGTEFLPPLPASPKLFTARGNSACFTRVGKSAICRQPVMEQRYSFNLVGHNSVWTVRDGFQGDGWNYEMVCVMGKPCHNVSTTTAYDHVFGYVNMLDHSGAYDNYPYSKGNKWAIPDEEKVFADWAYEGCYNHNTQIPTPIGPYIVTRDEVPDPHDQMIEERESGRLVSLGSAQAVCFTFAEMIAYASGFLTLQPGDMMSSASISYDGYPSFPGRYPEDAYLQATVSKLGTLRLRIRDERKEL